VRSIGEFALIEASGLTPGVWAGTIAARDIDGKRVDFKADTLNGDKTRLRLAELLRPSSLAWLDLEHGTRLVVLGEAAGGGGLASVGARWAGDEVRFAGVGARFAGDAAILHVSGTAVAFTTADCVPVVVSCLGGGKSEAAAGQGEAVAGQGEIVAGQPWALAIHAGWRGIAEGIIGQALARFLMLSSVDASQCQAWIGLAIDQPNYEVGEEAYLRLMKQPTVRDNSDRLLVPNRPGHWLADLPGMAEALLAPAGITNAQVKRSGLSTYNEAWLHSARRDGEASGRMATVVGIEP